MAAWVSPPFKLATLASLLPVAGLITWARTSRCGRGRGHALKHLSLTKAPKRKAWLGVGSPGRGERNRARGSVRQW